MYFIVTFATRNGIIKQITTQDIVKFGSDNVMDINNRVMTGSTIAMWSKACQIIQVQCQTQVYGHCRCCVSIGNNILIAGNGFIDEALDGAAI